MILSIYLNFIKIRLIGSNNTADRFREKPDGSGNNEPVGTVDVPAPKGFGGRVAYDIYLVVPDGHSN